MTAFVSNVYLCLNMGFSNFIENTNTITILDSSCRGINGIDPHFLASRCLENIHVSVGRVCSRFVVKPGKLKRILRSFRIIPAIEGGNMDRERVNYFVRFQLPS